MAIFSDKLDYVVDIIPTSISYNPFQVTTSKMEIKQTLCNALNCTPHYKDNEDKYYGIQYGLKKDFDPHVDISATHGLMHI